MARAMSDFIQCIGDIGLQAVRYEHGERFILCWFDRKATAAMIAKKVRHLKRVFQPAEERGQLDHRALRRLTLPKSAKQKVRVFTDDECRHLCKATRQYEEEGSLKKDRDDTWEWHVKDIDRRMLPLTADLVKLLVEHQNSEPEGNPYVFVPPHQHERIQEFRRAGKWTVEHTRFPLQKFCYYFNKIRRMAGIKSGIFHDLRRTCLRTGLPRG